MSPERLKNICIAGALSLAMAAPLWGPLAALAWAQNSATGTGTVGGRIVKGIAIAPQNTGLNFGNIVGQNAGTVTEAGGMNTFSNTQNNPGASNAGTVQDAMFSVTGEPGLYFSITTPASVVISHGADNLTVDLTNLSPAMHNWNQLNTAQDNPEVGAATGQYIFDIGGTLHMTATAGPGLYTGIWNEEVAYQ